MKSLINNKLAIVVVILGALLIGGSFVIPRKKDNIRDVTIPNHKLLEHEKLGRGVIAIPLEKGRRVYWGEGTFDADKGRAYIGWRLLANDPDNVSFNVYRQVDNKPEIKLNDTPIRNSTNFVDDNLPSGEKYNYTVRPVIDGKEGMPSQPYSFTDPELHEPYLSIKLNGDYDFAKAAIADLDGDGEYDFVIKQPGGNVDPWYLYWRPSQETFKLEAYKRNGEHLWTYDMGWAIEHGVWYSPYIAYDLNGNGKAEIAVKSGEDDPRDSEGKVMSGPEYLTIMDGTTGNQIAQTDWIPREPFFEVNERHAYNYASRNQMGVAYLDGVNPHLVVVRGTYNLMIVRAYRLIEDELKLVWEWDNRNVPREYWGQGGHWVWVADVDGDGRDEIILGSCALDNDGTELWSTGLGHNDHGYIGNIDPDRPGLEMYLGIERTQANGNGICLVDAKTGEIIWGVDFPTDHIHGAGMASDICRVNPGRQLYSVDIVNFEGKRRNYAVMHNNKGEIIDREFIGGLSPRSVYWDSGNQRELLVGGRIFDYKGPTTHHENIEGRVMAVADIFGDWREEIITSLPGELRIYTTTILTNRRHTTLMQDPIYRNNVALASMGYYQVPMTTNDIPYRSSR